MSWGYEECFDIRHADEEFGICTAGYQPCFHYFLTILSFALFRKVMYILYDCMLEV